ncbi:hypothetical protein OQA88_9078 [Cercophora sp. LCS_1]
MPWAKRAARLWLQHLRGKIKFNRRGDLVASQGTKTSDTLPDAITDIWGAEGGVPGEASMPTCNDGGAELLSQAAKESKGTEESTEFSAGHAGFRVEDTGSLLRPSTIPEAERAPDTREADHSGPDQENRDEAFQKLLDVMDTDLRDASEPPLAGTGDYYIPNDRLFEIVDRRSIENIVPYIKNGIKVEDIYGKSDKDKNSLRKILATLVLIGEAPAIVEFVDEGLTDSCLPFASLPVKEHGSKRRFKLCRDGESTPIRLFGAWKRREIEAFEKTQWQTLAPFFGRGEHYELSWKRPFPFQIIEQKPAPGITAHRNTPGKDGIVPSTESRSNSWTDGVKTAPGAVKKVTIQEGHKHTPGIGTQHDTTWEDDTSTEPRSNSSIDGMKGAHGVVRRITIHRAHHNLPSYRGGQGDPAFALKQLFSDNEAEFNNEVSVLRRLNNLKDPHLVKLILTMEIIGPESDRRFYLMFPLADSNLRQFWHNNLNHETDPGKRKISSSTRARWVANQFYGLAFALSKLHDLNQKEAGRAVSVDDNARESDIIPINAPSARGDPHYGIHGDIKPENLLWHEKWAGRGDQESTTKEEALGVLQLADFGITKLHHTDTRSDADMRRATKSYAPPEKECQPPATCSRSWDIWSLGCVFLEFMCWLVQGGSCGRVNPVDAFREERTLERENKSLEGAIQDTFYHIIKTKDKTKFDVNPAVTKRIEALRTAPTSSDFVIDILDIIQAKMLLVEPDKISFSRSKQPRKTDDIKRITCYDLVKRLERIKNTANSASSEDYFTKKIAQRQPKDPRIQKNAVTIKEPAEALLKKKRTMSGLIDGPTPRRDSARHGNPSRMSQQVL